MNSTRHTARALHEEHRANLELLGRVELAMGRTSRTALRSAAAPGSELLRLVAALEHQVAHDVERHFVFEETELFSRMAASGDGRIAALLAEEHAAIRDVAAELLPMARAVAAGALDDAGWAALAGSALELVERQVSHIQKEEMALLPMLEDLLDDETDRRLAMEYCTA
jgi:hemerythrin-like domain-containing protein